MPSSEPIDPATDLWSQLAYTLRALRESRGLTQDQLAKELYVTRPAVQAWEGGRNRPDRATMQEYDKFFATGRLCESARHHATREHVYSWHEEFFANEAIATCIRAYSASHMPGLLQTEAYMRAAGGQFKNIETVVRQRLARQKRLDEAGAPRCWTIIDESAIRRPCGGEPGIMREQLAHLIAMSEREDLTILIVPESAGVYVGLIGDITLHTLPDLKVVGWVEAHFGGRLLEDPIEVERLQILFDRIRDKALPDRLSRDLIFRTMERLQ
ncbi:helix-turn-helix transcriptional regulator [Actinocorallia longicatena]|uniref:Helix-turn-helix transcriptional regulator n=1 Tax=Actinocorallia longicatena TaxID=111803 RepID=A0ABP6QMS6_9ACTN